MIYQGICRENFILNFYSKNIIALLHLPYNLIDGSSYSVKVSALKYQLKSPCWYCFANHDHSWWYRLNNVISFSRSENLYGAEEYFGFFGVQTIIIFLYVFAKY